MLAARTVILVPTLVVILCSLTGMRSPAADWHVDNAIFGGENSGTDWANAWTNFSSVVWGSSGVKAGDTLFISGGSASKIYTNTWTVGASGTPGNPIRIAIDAANSNHNGVVIFDYDYAGDQGTLTGITCVRNYITIDGNVAGACHLVISNLRNYQDRYTAVGIYGDSTTGIIIDHVASTNCNNPIRFIYSTGFRIRNCNFRQVRGDAALSVIYSSGTWDSNLIYSNHFELLYNSAPPPGRLPYAGPDGIQCGPDVSIFANTFHEVRTTEYTSDQHPDFIQATGNRTRIYGNEFINIGDSAVDWEVDHPILESVWIYNNVFRIQEAIDDFPEFIRIYNGPPAELNNIKIVNNTFVDNTNWLAITIFNVGNPTGGSNEIKNNIFYNCGNGTHRPVVSIEDACGYTAGSFAFDGNIYYHPGNQAYVHYGPHQLASVWVGNFEPHGKTNALAFLTYSPFGAGNNLRLSSSDAAAMNGGVDLSSLFTSDKDGVSRPQGPGWDIGAYEFGSGGGNAANLAPTVSVIGQNVADADPGAPGLQILTNTVVEFSGLASDPNGDALTWQWIYSTNGAEEVVYQSGTGAVTSVSFSYGAGAAGATYVWKLRVSDGQVSSESRLIVGVVTAPRVADALTFEAESGDVAAPFVTTNGYIWQPTQTGVANGGRAAYDFTITNAGDYVVAAVVAAPAYGERTLYANIDAEPQEPGMIWWIPFTTGFEQRVVSWQGNASCLLPWYAPKIFNLSDGRHQLIIRGRDANTKVDQISLVAMPVVTTLTATNVTHLSATLNGTVNSRGTATAAYFEFGVTTNYSNKTIAANIGNGSSALATSDTLFGLPPLTMYHFRLVAYNSSVTNFGADLTFTTALPPNTAPVLPAQTNMTMAELSTMRVTNTATDTDLPANSLTYALLVAPTNAAIDSNGVITWTPDEAQGPGTYIFKMAVTDNGSPPLSEINSFTVVVTEVNVAPELWAQTNRTMAELTTLTVTNTATDADLPANTLSYTLLVAPTNAVIDFDGVIIWTPGETQGPSTNIFKTVVTDNGVPPLKATNSFAVVVTELNEAPVLPAQINRTLHNLASLVLTNTALDADLPANELSYELAVSPVGVVIHANGVITWTPSAGQRPSTNTITTVVTDNGAPPLRATNSFTVTVNNVNTAPVLPVLTNVSIGELSTLMVTNRATDGDIPANTLSYALTGPTNATIDAFGVIAWTPNEAQGPCTNTFTTVVTDDGEPELSATNSFTVTVLDINSPPVLATNADVTIDELSTLMVTNRATDGDIPANTLIYLLTGPANATIDANGVIVWTPDETQGPGTNTFTTMVTDNGVPPLSVTNRFTVTVLEINSPPVLATNADVTMLEGQTLVVTNLATDLDVTDHRTVTNTFNFVYTNQQALLADGWSFSARTSEGLPRDTEITNGAVISYDQIAHPGVLRIPCDLGDWWAAANTSRNSLFRNLSSNWMSLQMEASLATTMNFQQFHLAVYQDDDNYVQAGLAHNDVGPDATLSREVDGGPVSFSPRRVAATNINVRMDRNLSNGRIAGLYSLDGINWLTISEIDQALVNPRLGIWVGGSPIPYTNGLANCDLHRLDIVVTNPAAANTLTFALVAGPNGMTIDASSGLLFWTPDETAGPGLHHVSVSVTDNGAPPLSVTNSFNVTLVESPRLSSPTYEGDQVSVSFFTRMGRRYHLEHKANLNDANWTSVTNVLGDGTRHLLVDPSVTGPHGYYRVQVEILN